MISTDFHNIWEIQEIYKKKQNIINLLDMLYITGASCKILITTFSQAHNCYINSKK